MSQLWLEVGMMCFREKVENISPLLSPPRPCSPCLSNWQIGVKKERIGRGRKGQYKVLGRIPSPHSHPKKSPGQSQLDFCNDSAEAAYIFLPHYKFLFAMCCDKEIMERKGKLDAILICRFNYMLFLDHRHWELEPCYLLKNWNHKIFRQRTSIQEYNSRRNKYLHKILQHKIKQLDAKDILLFEVCLT